MDAVATGVVTNKVPTAPYRGAGRPEAVFALERAIERAAHDLEIDPVEIRIRNLITPKELPNSAGILYRDGHPLVLDSGNYPKALARAAELINGEPEVARATDAAGAGFAVGTGYACYVEGSGIGPFEGAVVKIESDGTVVVSNRGFFAGSRSRDRVRPDLCR